jgi:signal transduction histidine kinase
VRGTARRAEDIPWLAPGAPALVALATAADATRSPAVLADPAAVALVVRFGVPESAGNLAITPPRIAALLAFARKHLPDAVEPPSVVRFAAIRCGTIARAIASQSHPKFATHAYACGVLAGLGPLAGGGVELTRRLARRWRLPAWCADVLVNLVHPAKDEAVLHAVTRAAAFVLDQCGGPALTTGLSPRDLVTAGVRDVEAVVRYGSPPARPIPGWENPAQVRLLPELLRLAQCVHGRRSDDLRAKLEGEADDLHQALAQQRLTEDERVRDRKLVALAELAAGAGHEINAPLAVISGQAQLLLSDEGDRQRRRSLQTIVQQARRAHEILTDLMQFARPSSPNRQLLDAALLAQDVLAGVHELAEDRSISVRHELPPGLLAYADPRQLRLALGNLVRNAIQAAPDGGWVRVSAAAAASRLRLAVEDNGPGPDPGIVEHLFDPFFSGRQAGRGRGLGLSTAWRLAREQGGALLYEPRPGGPTCFVLSIPAADSAALDDRLSA